MSGKLKLVRHQVQRVNFWYYAAVRMRVECTDARGDDLDTHIFIYSREPEDPYTGKRHDLFHAVCGPADMADIPAGEPDPGRMWPFYRRPFIEHDFRNPSEAAKVWQIIQAEANVLCEAFERFSNLQVEQILWIPGPPDDPDSPDSPDSPE